MPHAFARVFWPWIARQHNINVEERSLCRLVPDVSLSLSLSLSLSPSRPACLPPTHPLARVCYCSNKRYAGLENYDIKSCAAAVQKDFGKVCAQLCAPPPPPPSLQPLPYQRDALSPTHKNTHIRNGKTNRYKGEKLRCVMCTG